MNDSFFTEFIIIGSIVGVIVAFLIIKRIRDEWKSVDVGFKFNIVHVDLDLLDDVQFQ